MRDNKGQKVKREFHILMPNNQDGLSQLVWVCKNEGPNKGKVVETDFSTRAELVAMVTGKLPEKIEGGDECLKRFIKTFR